MRAKKKKVPDAFLPQPAITSNQSRNECSDRSQCPEQPIFHLGPQDWERIPAITSYGEVKIFLD